MTAEVVVMNKMGVALAADSAVTFRSAGGIKIYNTVNKLFRLSNFHPVGIMIFDNSELMGIPWETIIKSYANQLLDKKFDTLQEYANDFISSLNTNNSLFPPLEQERYVYISINEFLSIIISSIQDYIETAIERLGEINKDQIRKIVQTTVTGYHKLLKSCEKSTSVPEDHATSIITKYRDQIEYAKEEVFSQLPLKIPKSLDETLTEMCGELFIRKHDFTSLSGIVISGFGDKEYFPSVISYLVGGVANDKLKYDQDSITEITTTMDAFIVPFAQREMVDTFIGGVNSEYIDFSKNYLKEIIDNYPSIILDNLNSLSETEKNKFSKKLKKTSDGLVEDFMRSMIDYRQNEFVNPIIHAVSALPKEELTVLAESLVNLTALKQKMSMSHETVGGFIDVAVITKGDGFVWIKQKKLCN